MIYIPSILKKRVPAVPYEPKKLSQPNKMLAYNSAWNGLQLLIDDIITQFNITPNKCLEFGVEYGFSTTAFANYFKEVTGVDTFTGDVHAGIHEDNFEEMKKKVSEWSNIKLIKADYKDFIRNNEDFYDFIHVDIIHNYTDTFKCGLWAAQHSKIVVFHDTMSFKKVKHAVQDIAQETGKTFYNYPHCYGLGILF